MEGSLPNTDAPLCLTQLYSPTRVIMLGNPGAGKSTLLNGLVGKPVFNAGLSFQGTLTLVSNSVTASNGNVFIDTPGLSDSLTRDDAAKEITAALRENTTHGNLKLIFVITFNDGRVRTTDAATINLVLDALPENTPYGIIVNKIGTKALEQVRTVPKHLEQLTVHLNLGRENKTSFLHFIEHDEELVEAENAVPTRSNNELVEFINSVPFCSSIHKDDIDAVRSTETEDIEAKMSTLIREVEEDKQKMEKEMEIMEQKYEEKLAQLRQQYQTEEHTEKEEKDDFLITFVKGVTGVVEILKILQPQNPVSYQEYYDDENSSDAAYMANTGRTGRDVEFRTGRDVEVGPIQSNAHAPHVVNSWLAENPGWEWNGHWVSKNGTSYAGMVPKRITCLYD
jgi:GTP-binding protein EngB required for normal cell division